MSQEEDFILPDGRKTSELKVVDLKKELTKVGKRKSGTKSDLLNRLKEALSASTNSCDDNHKEQPVGIEASKIQRTIINTTRNAGVDLDDSDDMRHDSLEINQSVDTLELGAPIDDSLNPLDDTAQEDQIQISLSKDEEAEMSLEDNKDDHIVPFDEESKDQRIVLREQEVEEEEPKRNVIENEADLMLEVFEADNIDLETEDHSKKSLGSDSETITVTLVNEGNKKKDKVDEGKASEEIEVAVGGSGVSITARLGKRKMREDTDVGEDTLTTVSAVTTTASSSTTSKRSGVRETKGSGHAIEEPLRVRSPQKSRSIISDILRVDHLVRPFTMTQLQDVLSARGKVIDLWLNKIKSVAYVRYDSESSAINARESLDGCKWPSINPKLLVADFAPYKEMEWMKEKGDSGVNPPPYLRQTAADRPNNSTNIDAGNSGDHQQRNRGDRRAPVVPEKVADSVIGNNIGGQDNANKRRRSHSNNERRRASPKRAHRDQINIQKERTTNTNRDARVEKPAPEPAVAARMLEDIFRKTVTQPPIYWLPVSKEKATVAAGTAAAAVEANKVSDRRNVGGL